MVQGPLRSFLSTHERSDAHSSERDRADVEDAVAHAVDDLRRSERFMLASAEVTAAIASAVTEEQVYEAVVDRIAPFVRVSTCALYRLDAAESVARLVRCTGYSDVVRQRLQRLPLDGMPLPAVDAMRERRVVVVGSQAELLAQYPHLAPLVTAGMSYRIVCLPIEVQGRGLGSLALTLDETTVLNPEKMAVLQVVARYAGQALERLRLHEEERASRMRSERLQELTGRVLHAKRLDDVYEAALDALEPACGAARAAILTYGNEPRMRFRAWRGLSDAYRRAVDGHSPWAKDAQNPAPLYVDDVNADDAWSAYRDVFAAEGIRALGFVPLVADGVLVGKCMVYFATPQHVAADARATVTAIANHVAAAVSRFHAIDELRESLRANEILAGMLGHDLRTPLAAIVNGAEVVLLRAEGERSVMAASRIMSSGRRMERMISDLLDYTRVRVAGCIPVTKAPMSVDAIARDVLAEIEVAHPAIRFHLDVDGDARADVDGDRIAQVFTNLLANAAHHGAGGDVHMRLVGEARRLVAEIENEGAIDAEVLPHLFKATADGHRRQSASEGLGLGLYIANEIAKAHGGSIDALTATPDRVVMRFVLPR